MSKSRRQSKEVYNKKKDRDIIVKIDQLSMPGKPLTRGTQVIHGKKYDKKGERKRVKMNLKKYIG